GRFRFGLGVFPVSGGTFLYRHIVTPFWAPAAVTYATNVQELAIAPSLAFRILGNGDFSLALGYSPQFHYATLQIKGPVQQPLASLSPEFQLSSIFVGSTSLTTYSIPQDLTTF